MQGLQEPLSVVAGLEEPFDASEQLFISAFHDNSLILIEDASDVVREFLQAGRLEKMLKLIAKGLKEKYNTKIISVDFYQDKDEIEYKDDKQIRDNSCFGLIELRLHEEDQEESFGGHFCGFIKKNGGVLLFDPMSYVDEKDGELDGSYYDAFVAVAEDKMGISKDAIVGAKIVRGMNQCFQLTGGFPATSGRPDKYKHDPEISIGHLQRYEEYMTHYPRNLVSYMIEYGPDSQNHFCYMWSMFWLHKTLGSSVEGVDTFNFSLEELAGLVGNRDLIPVSVIKSYIMGWIEYFKKDLINKTTCEKGTEVNGRVYSYPKGYLYSFVKENFPKTLFWKSLSGLKMATDSKYLVKSGPVFRDGTQ
jgi:hypothetical protein